MFEGAEENYLDKQRGPARKSQKGTGGRDLPLAAMSAALSCDRCPYGSSFYKTSRLLRCRTRLPHDLAKELLGRDPALGSGLGHPCGNLVRHLNRRLVS